MSLPYAGANRIRFHGYFSAALSPSASVMPRPDDCGGQHNRSRPAAPQVGGTSSGIDRDAARGLIERVSRIVLRASLPALELHARFLDAIGDGREVDLLVEGRSTFLLPGLVRRLRLGGREAALAATAGMALFPRVMLILLQARSLGRTFRCRRVLGAREMVVEIRVPQEV